MALINRQNNLFAAEDWKVAYKAYSEVNFQAYDFDTIRSALVDYVRTNFPENFNDYIDSSEFIAIIELLAYLSQSLAFRMDLNSRENFLETAERRDSVFKLARMLGYNPRRNVPASGLMKIVAVRTNEPITDSLGNDLNNINIFWDDANNPDAYEQFITILNSAMNVTNRFSTPTKTGTVNDINCELYEINTPATAPLAYDFELSVSGVERNFQVVNPDFKDAGTFFERHPDPVDNFNIVYRNDGTGISSNNSGFFVMFKQGTLSSADYNYTTRVENRTQNVDVGNINETDVFLQQIESNGTVLQKWTQIPNTIGQTLNYNDVALGTRTLYSIENLNNAGIKLRFPDGNFGDIPFGLFRLRYRTSDPETFTLQPEDARNVKVNIPYQNAQGTAFTLTLTFSLQESVSNSLPPETLTAIKQRAPQVYYTQNRMVSAQDYNIFPFSQTTNILKLKAINKTHAGHSRYIDINDPTGTYQNLETFASDGALYREFSNGTDSTTISENNTTSESIDYDIPLMLKNKNLNNFVYENFRQVWTSADPDKFNLTSKSVTWKTLPAVSGKNITGYFEESSSGTTRVLVNSSGTGFEMFVDNNLLKFVNPSDQTQYQWARVVSVANNGALSSGLSTSTGPFKLSAAIQDGWSPREFISTMRKSFIASEKSSIKAEMDNKRNFGLGYDPVADSWYVITNTNLDKTSKWSPTYAGNTSGTNLDASWLLLFTYSAITTSNYKYTVTLRGQQYIVQSKNDLKFYNINNVKVADSTNNASKDLITFTTLNYKPGTAETFTWTDNDSDDLGEVWESDETFEQYTPNSYNPDIPLKTRGTKWYNVEVDFVTNVGIFQNGDSVVNKFVSQATVPLQTYFADGTQGTAASSNATIANNSGRIGYLPANISIPFSNTTFGYNILDTANGNVVYKDYNSATGQLEIYKANINGNTHSFGATGTAYNASSTGRLILSDANTSAQTGNLLLTGVWNNSFTHFTDGTTNPRSRDKIVVKYKTDKEQIDQNIEWNVIAPVKYNDGYTDNRKAVVYPIDTDGDLVPDRPLQFREFVGTDDLIFFEYYTDFDGYSYDRPLAGNIVDYRSYDDLTVSFSTDSIKPTGLPDTRKISDIDLLVVKDISLIGSTINGVDAVTNSSGLIIYDYTTEKMYKVTPDSSSPTTIAHVVETTDYFVRNGRASGQNTALIEDDDIIFKWKHVAPKDVRIDPSISNIIEMLVLTNSYYSEIQKYKNVPGTEYPLAPTQSQLATEFSALDEFKTASDSLVYKSAEFKLLFGTDAEPENQAKFRIVRLPGSSISDNEIKSRVIAAFNTFFDVNNWEFGETFYFTELSSYVHQRLGSNIGSIVIIPRNTAGTFGDLFQIKADPNELFLNTAKVSDIEIVEKISSQTLRADR